MQSDGIVIRLYRDSDTEAVIDVVGKTLVGEKVIPETDLPLDDEDLQNIAHYYSGKSRFWVAEQNGRVIGTIGLKDKGENIAKLRRMFVMHALHGTGIGQKLLNTALSYAKQQGFVQIVLNTHDYMKRAHHFYEKNGFILKSTGSKPHARRYELSLIAS